MSETKIRIGICQLNCNNDKERNLQIGKELIKKGKDEKAKMIFFPEGFDFISHSKLSAIEQAEFLDGRIINEYRKLAKENQIWLSLGGFHEKIEKSDKILNTHLIINDQGNIVAKYDKIHLFDVQSGSTHFKESDSTQSGSQIVSPIATPVGRIGLAICYDLRFPELARLLTLCHQFGAQILTYPSAFTKTTGEAHWQTLLQARAIENQCFVVAAAQVGWHNEKRESYGHSLIVDPWGKILLDMNLQFPSIETIEIDLKRIEQVRKQMPIVEHRRQDLYRFILSKNILVNINDQIDKTIHWGQIQICSSQIFYRSTLTFATVNKKPIVNGHLLVSPIRCVQRFYQLTNEEINDLFLSVQLISTKIEQFYQGKSLSIAIQDGQFAGQTIQHVHVHILPRKEGDFQDNDNIYRQLAHHDKEETQWRNEQQMADEAKILRTLFYPNVSASI